MYHGNGKLIDPITTGNTLLCDLMFECTKHITMHVIRKKHFQVILKLLLQNCLEISNKSFLVTACMMMCLCLNLQLHNNVLPVIKGLTHVAHFRNISWKNFGNNSSNCHERTTTLFLYFQVMELYLFSKLILKSTAFHRKCARHMADVTSQSKERVYLLRNERAITSQ